MASFDNGYIKIFRKMLRWEWYEDTNTVRVFLHCLLKANWKEKTWHGVEIKRGSFITSRQKLARELGLTEKQVRVSLDHLEMTGEVARSSTSKYSVITVIKYDDYQQEGQQEGKEKANKRANKGQTKGPQNSQVRATTEEREEIKEEKKKNIKPPRRGWELAQLRDSEWLREHHPSEWKIEEVNGVFWAHRVKR